MLKHAMLMMMAVVLLAAFGCAASPERDEVKQRSDYRQYGTGNYRMAD